MRLKKDKKVEKPKEKEFKLEDFKRELQILKHLLMASKQFHEFVAYGKPHPVSGHFNHRQITESTLALQSPAIRDLLKALKKLNELE